MLNESQILSFLLTTVLLTATPGPDNLMVLSIGISNGRRAGMAFGLGCAVGCLSHTLLAVVGVSAILAASPTAFMLLKWTGGAYLLWLGIQALRHAGTGQLPSGSLQHKPLRSLFLQGLIANAINPKVVLFFLSFLPQFVIEAQGHVEWQLGLLGALFSLQAAILFGVLGYFSGAIGIGLSRRPAAGRWLDRAAGAIFVALGLRMMVSR
jgi:threonine/homoserine/homoserine lactone efflux protein